jgi:hypothetical protein
MYVLLLLWRLTRFDRLCNRSAGLTPPWVGPLAVRGFDWSKAAVAHCSVVLGELQSIAPKAWFVKTEGMVSRIDLEQQCSDWLLV